MYSALSNASIGRLAIEPTRNLRAVLAIGLMQIVTACGGHSPQEIVFATPDPSVVIDGNRLSARGAWDRKGATANNVFMIDASNSDHSLLLTSAYAMPSKRNDGNLELFCDGELYEIAEWTPMRVRTKVRGSTVNGGTYIEIEISKKQVRRVTTGAEPHTLEMKKGTQSR